MEYGVSSSTLVFADALSKHERKFSDEIKRLRRSNPFELHAVDNERKWIQTAEARLPEKLKNMRRSMKVRCEWEHSMIEYVPHLIGYRM